MATTSNLWTIQLSNWCRNWPISHRRKVPLKRQLCCRPFLLVGFTSYHSAEHVEYQNSQISTFLAPWSWLHRTSCHQQTISQGSMGSALRIHEERSCACLKGIFTCGGVVHFGVFKAAGNAPQSMVADFLISHQEEKGSELPQELEASMKAAAATMYLGGHLMPLHFSVLTVTIP